MTIIKTFDDLFQKEERYKFYDEIGALEVQNEVIETYRRIEKERESLKSEIEKYVKPIVLTEGKTDAKILRVAWKQLYPDAELPFEFIPSGIEIDEDKREGSADQVRRSLELSANMNKGRRVIGLFDNDREGNEKFSGVNKETFEDYDIGKVVRKHREKEIYALLLPCPVNRQIFVSPSSMQQRYFVIEHYFDDETLSANKLKGENILGTEVFEIIGGRSKTKFAEEVVPSLSSDKFVEFKLLFQKLNELIRNSN